MKKYSDYFKYLIFFDFTPNKLSRISLCGTNLNEYVKHFKFFYNNNLLFLFLQIYPNQRNINKYTCLTITHFSDQKSL